MAGNRLGKPLFFLVLILSMRTSAVGSWPAANHRPAGTQKTNDQDLVDLYGDPLPPRAIARLGTLRFRTPREAMALAFAPDGKTIAVSAYGGVYLFDADTGKQIKRVGDSTFAGNLKSSLAFSPDGKRLADWGRRVIRGDGKPWDKRVLHVWQLSGDQALRARWALATSPASALPLLEKHLKAAQPADAKRLQQLLRDLDSEVFAVRMAAAKGLEELGESAAPALRQALAKGSSLELSRRVEALLDKLRGPIRQPDLLRAVRAVAALEDAATPEARKLLETLANGAPEARVTQESRAALKRLTVSASP